MAPSLRKHIGIMTFCSRMFQTFRSYLALARVWMLCKSCFPLSLTLSDKSSKLSYNIVTEIQY